MGGKRTHVMTHLATSCSAGARQRAGEDAPGGERNCLLLARHFAKEANVLVLDEPTNDPTSTRWSCWKTSWPTTRARCSSSATTGAFSITWSPVAWSPKATGLWREYEGGITDWQAQRA